ncbi:MAG: hypothetical protein K2Q17_09845 [Nitrospiraceae bacterium]|nr:hypothetical protein [Nitrospiraceae bacterium]
MRVLSNRDYSSRWRRLRVVVSTIGVMWTVSLPGAMVQADVGLLPTPTLTGVQTRAAVTFDPTSQIYSYNYTVTNPSSNTGQIWMITVDATTKFPRAFVPAFDSTDLTIPYGISTLSFDDMVSPISPLDLPVSSGYLVAFGQQVPAGWSGGLTKTGLAQFWSLDDTPNVGPGGSISGLILRSRGLPTLKTTEAVPFWNLVLNSEGDSTPEIEQASEQIRQTIVFRARTLGPSGVTAGTFGHWEQLQDDLNQTIQLGWIPDLTLANALVTQLASARQAVEAQDGTLAKTRLNTLIQTISSSTPAQRREEVAALVLLNAQALRDNTGDTVEPLEPQITLTPGTATSPIGTIRTITAKVINVAVSTHPPVPNYTVTFRVTDGPNSGFDFSQTTDATGQAPLSLTSSGLGTDRVAAGLGGEVFEEHAYAMVTWDGGPDVVVPLFAPSVLQSQSGNPVTITEWTRNTGTVAVGPSITRYYLSPTAGVDPDTALVLGERSVPALAPGEISKSPPITLTMPPGFPLGTYNLAACADAHRQVTELQEENNCSFNILNTSQSVVVPHAFAGTPNDAPICTTAGPSTDRLWPPNHRLATVSVQGVTDPNGDPITITITAITQDEPVNGLGDGDTAPDGFGVETSQAQLRSERSGTGNGRVYALSFKASDGKGGSCTGRVTVGVPHDQGQQSMPINDGQNYDSTKTP